MKFIYLLCGPSGAGKSTWIQKDIEYNDNLMKEIKEPSDSIWVSRDKIRFSLVPEDAPYFSQENRVYNKWIEEINKAIKNPVYTRIYADATNLTKTGRARLLNRLSLGQETQVVAVNMLVDEETAIKQNAQRSGRALVPEDVIRNMYKSFIPATTEEEGINFVLEVKNNE